MEKFVDAGIFIFILFKIRLRFDFDQLIYELYGLTEDKLKIVEGKDPI
ncbi:MAG: hypothetical protein MUO26_16180 [Methanotrichaceae archaeon]|nr:hypothetical protein [Methanotrichaceae archaeon]